MTDREDKPVRVPIEGDKDSGKKTDSDAGDTGDADEDQGTVSEEAPGDANEQSPQAESEKEAPEIAAEKEDRESKEARDWKAKYEQEREKRLRAVADLKNYRRRSTERQAQQRRYANEALLADLLGVLDNFDEALCSLEDEDCGAEMILQGVEMIQRQLQELIRRHGVEQIEAQGVRFDPNYHEAVERVETDEHPEMQILEVTTPGYMLHDRVLRPARVRVAVSPDDEEPETQDTADTDQ